MGKYVDKLDLSGTPVVIDGKYSYEKKWDITGIASGTFHYRVQAIKKGAGELKFKGKFAIVK